jgi:hypothetical protein
MKKKMVKKILLVLIPLSIFLSIVTTTLALDYVELAPLPGTCEVGTNGQCVTKTGSDNLARYINSLYKLIVASAAVLAVLQIVMGGFSYVSTDAISNKEEGKHTIKMALGGLLLIFASYIILNTINPQLVDLKVVNDPLRSAGLVELLMLSRTAQRDFDRAVNKTLSELDELKKTTSQIRAEANALQQKANSYRDMREIQRIMNAQGTTGMTEEEVTRLQTLKDTYFAGKTDEEIKKNLEGLSTVEQEILAKTKESNIENALANLDRQALEIRNLAQAQSSAEGFKIDMAQKPENFKIQIADGKVHPTNPTDVKNALDAVENEYKDRMATINRLNLPAEQVRKREAEMRASADAAKAAICVQVPATTYQTSPGTGMYQPPTITHIPNPARSHCNP